MKKIALILLMISKRAFIFQKLKTIRFIPLSAVKVNRTKVKVMDAFADEASALFSECEDAFYDCEDNLLELNCQYIIKNKNSFSE